MRITVNLRHIWPIFFQELKERPDFFFIQTKSGNENI